MRTRAGDTGQCDHWPRYSRRVTDQHFPWQGSGNQPCEYLDSGHCVRQKLVLVKPPTVIRLASCRDVTLRTVSVACGGRRGKIILYHHYDNDTNPGSRYSSVIEGIELTTSATIKVDIKSSSWDRMLSKCSKPESADRTNVLSIANIWVLKCWSVKIITT